MGLFETVKYYDVQYSNQASAILHETNMFPNPFLSKNYNYNLSLSQPLFSAYNQSYVQSRANLRRRELLYIDTYVHKLFNENLQDV